MKDKNIWRAVVLDSEGREVCRAEQEMTFKKNAFSELMDLIDYAYYASAEEPLLNLPADHEIKIRLA